MDTLIIESWLIYERYKNQEFAVIPSIPILFFGDSKGYFESKTKVITVGLNPSLIEFPENDRYLRFDRARGIYPQILDGDYYQEYLGALKGYFSNNPYRTWFKLLRTATARVGNKLLQRIIKYRFAHGSVLAISD